MSLTISEYPHGDILPNTVDKVQISALRQILEVASPIFRGKYFRPIFIANKNKTKQTDMLSILKVKKYPKLLYP